MYAMPRSGRSSTAVSSALAWLRSGSASMSREIREDTEHRARLAHRGGSAGRREREEEILESETVSSDARR